MGLEVEGKKMVTLAKQEDGSHEGDRALLYYSGNKSCRSLPILPIHLPSSLIPPLFSGDGDDERWCLNDETALDRVRVKANETEDKLNGLKAWKVGMEKKFATLEKVRKELEEQMETLRKVLEDKEKEIKDANDEFC